MKLVTTIAIGIVVLIALVVIGVFMLLTTDEPVLNIVKMIRENFSAYWRK